MSPLADLVESNLEKVMERWKKSVREALPIPEPLPDVELIDSLPDYLKQMVQMLRYDPQQQKYADSARAEVAAKHGRQRYRLGFKLEELVREYGTLRSEIFDLIEESGLRISLTDLRGLSDFIANGVADGVRQYLEDREADARRRAEAAQVRSANARAVAERDASELKAIIDAIPDAVYVGDHRGVRYANRPAFEMLGYRSEAELQRDLDSLWAELDIRDFATGEPVPIDDLTFSRALRGEASNAEVIVRHLLRGEDMVIRSSGAPVMIDGKIRSVVVINRDITEEKRMLRERESRQQFEQQLIGIVSHDLRNPISAVLLSASMLLRNPAIAGNERRGLERIHSSAHRAERLIADLLDFTQARLGGGLPVTPQALDFHEQVHQAVEEVQLAHRGRQIELEQSGDGAGEWDPERINQIVSNLLGNALAYSRRDSSISVRTRGVADAVLLAVHNEGRTIPAKLIPGLFEPMKRGTGERGGSERSVGLGLYIVEQIVLAHGGHIAVESNERHGTTFTVSLPRRPRSREVGPSP